MMGGAARAAEQERIGQIMLANHRRQCTADNIRQSLEEGPTRAPVLKTVFKIILFILFIGFVVGYHYLFGRLIQKPEWDHDATNENDGKAVFDVIQLQRSMFNMRVVLLGQEALKPNTTVTVADYVELLQTYHDNTYLQTQRPDNKRYDLQHSVRGGTQFEFKNIWTTANSIMYSVTALLTIGYGRYAPATNAGKMLTLGMSIFGIPITLILIAKLGMLNLIAQDWIWTMTAGRLIKSCKKTKIDPDTGEEVKVSRSKEAPFAFCAILMLINLFMGMVLARYLEPAWNWVVAAYFVFISISTVGFGDYVIGQSDSHTAKGQLHVWMFMVYVLVTISNFAAFLNRFVATVKDARHNMRSEEEKFELDLDERTDAMRKQFPKYRALNDLRASR